jgi:membrane protein implicated in regulation of membrane protease activity
MSQVSNYTTRPLSGFYTFSGVVALALSVIFTIWCLVLGEWKYAAVAAVIGVIAVIPIAVAVISKRGGVGQSGDTGSNSSYMH